MVQQLKAATGLADDQGLAPSTHMVVFHNPVPMPSTCPFWAAALTQTQSNTHTNILKKSSCFF